MSAVVGDSNTEIRIFDPLGVPLCDLRAATVRSWVLNGIGDARLFISTEDYHFREEFLKGGNILLVNHTHLQSWVGFLDYKDTVIWHRGFIEIPALSAEKIFDWRFAKPTKENGSAGEIFEELLWLMNRGWLNLSDQYGIKIHPGDVWKGGHGAFYPRVGRAADVLKYLITKTKTEYSVTHAFDGSGKLYLLGNLFSQKGYDTGIHLDNKNLKFTDPLLTEDGDIANYVMYITSPQDGGQMLIGDGIADWESIAKYGLRMYLGEGSAENVETLNLYSKAYLLEHAWPHQMALPTFLNTPEQDGYMYQYLDTGNLYWMETHLAGWKNGVIGAQNYVRLTGFEMNDLEHSVNGIVEIWKPRMSLKDIYNL